MEIPGCFCWSRFGTEAGEPVGAILKRKEIERKGNRGVFLWGVGNALGPSMRELLRVEDNPEVIFSPIRTPAKPRDVEPQSVVRWTGGRDLYGAAFQLPDESIVTSRADPVGRPPRHYALVCYSEAPLTLASSPVEFGVGQLTNLLTSSKVGASQVTAIVRYNGLPGSEGTQYPAAMRARLVSPFFLELTSPEPACKVRNEIQKVLFNGREVRHSTPR